MKLLVVSVSFNGPALQAAPNTPGASSSRVPPSLSHVECKARENAPGAPSRQAMQTRSSCCLCAGAGWGMAGHAVSPGQTDPFTESVTVAAAAAAVAAQAGACGAASGLQRCDRRGPLGARFRIAGEQPAEACSVGAGRADAGVERGRSDGAGGAGDGAALQRDRLVRQVGATGA